MKKIFIILAFAILSACKSTSEQMPTARGVAGKPVTSRYLVIMPLGDSLTAGIDNNGAYRLPLYWNLHERGYNFDFVGSENWGPEALPDKDNEGHGGWRIDQVADGIEAKLSKYQPNVILLGAGGNDISQNFKVDQAPERLLDLIRRIHRHSPHALIIVQSRPLRTDALNAKVIAFNTALVEKVATEMKSNAQLFFQDNYSLLQAEDIGADKLHPNLEGNKKLANGWLHALERALN
jgi:Lysophospholipase L1 and related esterases